jgi:hypothetical protein
LNEAAKLVGRGAGRFLELDDDCIDGTVADVLERVRRKRLRP